MKGLLSLLLVLGFGIVVFGRGWIVGNWDYLRLRDGGMADSDDRALAHTAIRKGNAEQAAVSWGASGGTAQDLLIFGRNAAHNHPSDAPNEHNALNWYRAALLLNDNDPEVWQAIGLECRMQAKDDTLCTQFLAYNADNHLVDPTFVYRWQAWPRHQADGVTYTIEQCDDIPCLHTTSDGTLPPYRATTFQCMHLPAGHDVVFSAEIRVKSADSWRPLYVQGLLGGTHQGAWANASVQTDAWQQLEHNFIAPAYDDGVACFHPARLAGAGEVWVRDLSVEVDR